MKHHGKGLMGFGPTQKSDAWRVAAFLAVSGGFQDAYSFLARGKVFANAQTGNVVLFGVKLCEGDVPGAARYLLPVAAFTAGVLAAVWIRRRETVLHWRQTVLLAEIALLAAVGFMPGEWDFAANALVSFACAMQVQAFRKVHSSAYASTMCIGNLRAFAEWTGRSVSGGGRRAWLRAERYLAVIGLFASGALIGGFAVPGFGVRAIWFSCALLAVAFVLMFEPRKD